jgi:hypothetical protein
MLDQRSRRLPHGFARVDPDPEVMFPVEARDELVAVEAERRAVDAVLNPPAMPFARMSGAKAGLFERLADLA